VHPEVGAVSQLIMGLNYNKGKVMSERVPVKKKSTVAVKEEVKKPSKGKVDWAALGYTDNSEEYVAADDIKVQSGPNKFKVQAKKTYRIGFPFVAPSKKGGFEVRFKVVEHIKFYDESSESGARFVMPKDDKLRKQVIEVFGNKAVQTHYLTPVVVYDTNDEGKLLSRDSISYSIKVLAVTPGRYAKLKEAASKFNLADYDFTVTLDGDEKTEHFQKMNFNAVTKKDLMAKTAVWQSGLVTLPDDEEEDPIAVSMEEVIAECYELAPVMLDVLGTNEYKDSKIKEILADWSDEEEDDEDDDGFIEDEDDEDEEEDETEELEDEEEEAEDDIEDDEE
jgi:hypothetical protein